MKVYAYLKDSLTIADQLQQLKDTGLPTLIVADGISNAVQKRFMCPSLAFANQPLDIAAVAAECDIAVLNANHGTASALLLAGRPMLLLPLFLEQVLFAEAVCRMGAGIRIRAEEPDRMAEGLRQLTEAPSFRQAAEGFATRYRDFDPQQENTQMAQRIEELL